MTIISNNVLGRSWFTGSGKDGSAVKERLRKWLSKVISYNI